jgi:DNA repair exonuclease SbcCD ATPase subunit
MVSTALRQDKQTLLSQVTTLLTTAKKLESDSVKLNAQLLTERTSVQSLTKSFDQYEADQYRIMGNFETKIRDLESQFAKKTLDLERAKRQRDTLGIFLGVSILLSVLYFYLKIRYKLPI